MQLDAKLRQVDVAGRGAVAGMPPHAPDHHCMVGLRILPQKR
jgi:hypothetical protein